MSMRKLKFIIPDWDDIIDPKYDFINEENSAEYKKDKYTYGARIWNIYSEPPVDGVLVSRSVLNPWNSKDRSSKLLKILEKGSIKDFLNIPENLRDPRKFQVIGDCGAWQYIDLDRPPYDPIDTLEFYDKIGVDYGITVDHIAVGPYAEDRVKISLDNAIKSFHVWRKKYEKGDYKFILLGSAQGQTVDEYLKSIEKLYNVGYRYLAIGGLAKRKTVFIRRLIDRLIEYVKNKELKKIHFLGIARLQVMKILSRLTEYVEEVSFDNATFLRGAWNRSLGNYLTLNGELYTSIRVRIGSPMEKEILEYLHRYDRGEIDYEEIIRKIREYVILTGDTSYLPYYARTLKDKPWKKCKCKICSSAGIDVIIFRRNDRNRRRGFHNIWVFYKLLKSNSLPERFKIIDGIFDKDTYIDPEAEFKMLDGIEIKQPILIITNCTAEKNVDWNKVHYILKKHELDIPGFDIEKEDKYRKVLTGFIKPAMEMYLGSFKYAKKLYRTLKKYFQEVDLLIISARYGLIDSSTPIIPYEATLNTLSYKDIRSWSKRMGIENKLSSILKKNKYNTIIVILPRSYLQAIMDLVKNELDRPNVIILSPTSNLHMSKALIIHTGNMKKRIKMISLINKYIEYNIRRKTQKSIDEWIRRGDHNRRE